MFQQDFINNFSRLGERISNWIDNNSIEPILDAAIESSKELNSFFTPYMQRSSLAILAKSFLQKEILESWLSSYTKVEKFTNISIGIIMAGNIPAVGFHDLLSVLACGRRAVVKLSSKDKYLIPALIAVLCEINSEWASRVEFYTSLESFYNSQGIKIEKLIATGSNSTAQSVSNANSETPLLVRGRRFSYAVISGNETRQELEMLANDVFLYFGLGCRSVNYLLVPKEYNFSNLTLAFNSMRTQLASDCYTNCYKRAKAIAAMEGVEFIDGEFFLLKKSDNFYPAVSEISFSYYNSENDIINFELTNRDQIQKKYCTFGIAQMPEIADYADGIDTINFILK